MEVKERPLSWFVDRINSGEPTTFSRWGDGEWHSVFGRTKGKNCDGHDYFPKLGKGLRDVLKSRPSYVLGLQGLAVRLWPGRIEGWLAATRLADLDWIDADVFHNASRKGELEPLLVAIRARPLVFVGPPHLSRLNKFLGYRTFITVPPRNSFVVWPRLAHDIMAAADSLPAGSVISISAGMPAKLIVDKLHARYKQRHQVIDFGSVWDYYAGVASRRYMKGMDAFQLKE
jgi:hypothetical protein